MTKSESAFDDVPETYSSHDVLTFEDFIRAHYPEHRRRLFLSRAASKRVRVTYPLTGLVFLGVPLFLLSACLRVFREPIFNLIHRDLAESGSGMTPEVYHSVVHALSLASGALGAMGLLVGLVWGTSVARELLFEAEKLEMDLEASFFRSQVGGPGTRGFGGGLSGGARRRSREGAGAATVPGFTGSVATRGLNFEFEDVD